MRHARTFSVLLATVLAVPVTASAVPGLSDSASATISNARVAAASAATAMLQGEGEGRGQDPDKTTGLARAAEVSNSWRFTGAPKPGNGNGGDGPQGQGSERSRQVHAALAAGLSPSAVHNENLDKPGNELAGAFNSFKAKRDGHPGKGQGKGLGGPGGPDDEDPGDD